MGVTEEEIRGALFAMRGCKAPGIDGMLAIFFQKNWEVFKGDFTRTVRGDGSLDEKNERILWNGNQTEEFLPTRGIRQGDPLSPYIFVLCIEKLSHIIQDMVEDNRWKPMRAVRSRPMISHLSFTDDIVLFGEATVQQAQMFNQCLNKFCEASGQKVNPHKFSVFFSKNVENITKQNIIDLTGFSATHNLVKYLGMPILHERVSRRTFNFVVEKVRDRLSRWKRNCLSLPGRITLVKSVISTIPYYAMQSTKIPQITCLEIEKMQRNFLWGHMDNVRKPHPINWKTVCTPKDRGGFGIKHLLSMNDAFLMKMGWKLKTDRSNLHCQVLRGKYGRDRWGKDERPLIHLATTVIGNTDIECSVASYVSESGDWKTEEMIDFLSEAQIISIMNEMPPNPNRREDSIYWGTGGDGRFSVKKAYFALTQVRAPEAKWKWIWKLEVSERIRVFLWQMMHIKLPTRLTCSRWSGISSYCEWCVNQEEDVLHVMRDCQYAVRVWSSLVNPSALAVFFHTDLKGWINFNLSKDIGRNVELNWVQNWAVTMWMLWNWRNNALFDEDFCHPIDPQGRIMEFIKQIKTSMDGMNLQHSDNNKGEVLVSWEKPGRDWIKINSDGAVKSKELVTGCRALLRDQNGTWISAVIKKLTYCFVLKAEA
ncbi:putative ribonuclease H protein At1g65750 family [Senna tora]|uniref:Putative ribonuclease H protein At1g65750 family n=1 Tax=Senna tora TaxID=362788 RepID=A0A834WYE1_9FABA|nr:putative ribonuclease H protein At1g65750 family [Senna tora]